MKSEFEMSLVSELNYFLGLQIKQEKGGIFLHQEKYILELLNKYGMRSLAKHP